MQTQIKPVEQENKIAHKQESETLFSAVGMISGEVVVTTHSEGKQSFEVKQGDKLYQLYFTYGIVIKHFSLEMNNSETPVKNLLVYPKVTHFPDKNKPYKVSFQVKGWSNKPYDNWKPGEFKLCGLWQFIPVCRGPVVSIHKNKTSDRITWLKDESIELARKVQFLKASHIPLLWKDAPIKPFRFNPETKTHGDRYFVQIRAKFIPKLNTWGFIEEIEQPCKDYPKFLKPRKEDKQKVLAAKSRAN